MTHPSDDDDSVVDAVIVGGPSDRSQTRGSVWLKQFRDRLRRDDDAGTRTQFSPHTSLNHLGSFRGTFVLVFGGTTVVTLANPQVMGGAIYSSLAISLAFGAALFAALFVGGRGAQVNPAETLGNSLGGRQPRKMLALIPAQFGGAIVASSFVWMLYGNRAVTDAKLGAAIPPATNASWGFGLIVLVLELVGTYLLVYSGNRAQEDTGSRTDAIFASSAMLTILVFAGLMVSGASYNPARSFGPAFVAALGPASPWDSFRFYWAGLIGQVIGGMLAGWRKKDATSGSQVGSAA